jgi:hypothetical protein
MNVGQTYTGTGTGIETPPAGSIVDADEQTFWREVEKFKLKADEAYTLWQKLRTKRQAAVANPELQREYDDVMGQAESIQAKASDVERVAAQVREGMGDTIKSWFGLEGYEHARQKVSQLGFIPVLAVGLVAGAIAWISTWLSKAYVVDRKLDAVEALVDKGVDARTAGDMVADKGDPGALSSFFGNLGTGVAVAGLAAVVLYFFFQKKRGF